MQEQLWVLHQIDKDKANDSYNVPIAIRLKGTVDLTALQRALNAVVLRHEALRTTLRISDDKLLQVVNPILEVKIAFKDFRAEERIVGGGISSR